MPTLRTVEPILAMQEMEWARLQLPPIWWFKENPDWCWTLWIATGWDIFIVFLLQLWHFGTGGPLLSGPPLPGLLKYSIYSSNSLIIGISILGIVVPWLSGFQLSGTFFGPSHPNNWGPPVALLYSHTLQSVKIKSEKLKVSLSDLAGNCF